MGLRVFAYVLKTCSRPERKAHLHMPATRSAGDTDTAYKVRETEMSECTQTKK